MYLLNNGWVSVVHQALFWGMNKGSKETGKSHPLPRSFILADGDHQHLRARWSRLAGVAQETCFIFVPSSWHRASRSLGISCMPGRRGVLGASSITHKQLLLTISKFMLMRWLLMSQRKQPCDQRLRVLHSFSSLSLHLCAGRGAGDWVQSPMAKDLIIHAYILNPPWKSLSDRMWEASELVNSSRCWECVRLRKDVEFPRRSSPPPFLVLGISSIWLFLGYVFYNNLVNASKVFTWVLGAVLANYGT